MCVFVYALIIIMVVHIIFVCVSNFSISNMNMVIIFQAVCDSKCCRIIDMVYIMVECY